MTDGPAALCGTAFTPFEHFAPWAVDDEGRPVDQPAKQTEDTPVVLMLHGVFQPERFLELLRGYVTFAATEAGLREMLAKPHQYFESAVTEMGDNILAGIARDLVKTLRRDGVLRLPARYAAVLAGPFWLHWQRGYQWGCA